MLYFGKSDTGRKRSANQDCFTVIELREDILLTVVCDGMGGAAGGNIAAQTASKVFSESITRSIPGLLQDLSGENIACGIKSAMTEAASEANSAVFAMAKENPELTGMGTTLISALVFGKKAYIVNIGDSRLYTLTDTEIKKVTHDHSYVQYLVDMGQLTAEEAAKSPHRNIITRAIGSDSSVEADVYTAELSAENIRYILLCSDGLTNYVTEKEIHAVMSRDRREEDRASLEAKVTELIGLANKAGGGDNITALVVKA